MRETGIPPARETKRGHAPSASPSQGLVFPGHAQMGCLRQHRWRRLHQRPRESGKLRLVPLFLAIQVAQRRAYHLTGVFVATALYFLQHEPVKLVGQVEITDRHDSSFVDLGWLQINS